MTAAPTLFEGDTIPPQILANLDTARTRRSDPLTSHLAGDASMSSLQRSRGFIIRALTTYGPKTQPELIDIAHTEGLRLSDSRIRSAVSELAEDAVVEFTGFYRLTAFGHRSQVWQMVGGEAA